ncbi:MAG: pantoate--beta-alanine ligase [Gammaproteobacteria bacterium]|nr:pantoate--beta-alanine ligase [Gammaproteobacteria bacterium]
MKVYSDSERIREHIGSQKSNGEKIALVPTMGNLHKGHTSLIKLAKSLGYRVSVSIFVNPLQFNQECDFIDYPRTLDADIEQLSNLNVDLVFTPDTKSLYPAGTESATNIIVPELADEFDGHYRPGHFEGVCTVVCKLFNILTPDIAVFGKKDYQQLLVIRRMVSDLNFNIDIVAGDTERESNGLALSSRNTHLSPEQHVLASHLYTNLELAKTQFSTQRIASLEHSARSNLEKIGMIVDYFSIRDAVNLQPVTDNTKNIVILGAVWLGNTRLIDNILFPMP